MEGFENILFRIDEFKGQLDRVSSTLLKPPHPATTRSGGVLIVNGHLCMEVMTYMQ